MNPVLFAAVKTSEYQLFKLRVLDVIPISKDAAHIYIGMICLFLALLVFRAPLRSYRALIPGLVAALAMEVFDLRDDQAGLGHFRWTASLKDVVNTNLLPFALVTIARLGLIKREGPATRRDIAHGRGRAALVSLSPPRRLDLAITRPLRGPALAEAVPQPRDHPHDPRDQRAGPGRRLRGHQGPAAERVHEGRTLEGAVPSQGVVFGLVGVRDAARALGRVQHYRSAGALEMVAQRALSPLRLHRHRQQVELERGGVHVEPLAVEQGVARAGNPARGRRHRAQARKGPRPRRAHAAWHRMAYGPTPPAPRSGVRAEDGQDAPPLGRAAARRCPSPRAASPPRPD